MHIIDILPGGVVTGKAVTEIKVSDEGNFVYQLKQDIVMECHQNTGNVASCSKAMAFVLGLFDVEEE